jgi:hypothetical protein
MKKVEICRKESVMKMMVEHHFDVSPKGIMFYFVQPLKIYIKLFQNLVFPVYIGGLDYNSHIPICTSVDPPLRKMIQQNVFFKNKYSRTWLISPRLS